MGKRTRFFLLLGALCFSFTLSATAGGIQSLAEMGAGKKEDHVKKGPSSGKRNLNDGSRCPSYLEEGAIEPPLTDREQTEVRKQYGRLNRSAWDNAYDEWQKEIWVSLHRFVKKHPESTRADSERLADEFFREQGPGLKQSLQKEFGKRARTLETVLGKIQSGKIVDDPDYTRDRFGRELIEEFTGQLPSPPVHLESAAGKGAWFLRAADTEAVARASGEYNRQYDRTPEKFERDLKEMDAEIKRAEARKARGFEKITLYGDFQWLPETQTLAKQRVLLLARLKEARANWPQITRDTFFYSYPDEAPGQTLGRLTTLVMRRHGLNWKFVDKNAPHPFLSEKTIDFDECKVKNLDAFSEALRQRVLEQIQILL